MFITTKWLEENGACAEGKEWFSRQTKTEHKEVTKMLSKEARFAWANWTLIRIMTHKQKVQYACYAAKQTLHLFEKQCPNDKRPRQAIVAAYRWARNPSELNRSAAWSAAESAAWSAESAAESAARSAAWSAESAARSAARSAESAAWSAAESAARSAESAAWQKILKYGLRLTKGA